MQITSSMNDLNQVTQGNAASAQELASASEELDGQSNTLAELMKFYKVEVNENENQHAYVKVASPIASAAVAAIAHAEQVPKESVAHVIKGPIASAQNNPETSKTHEEEIDLGNFESM